MRKVFSLVLVILILMVQVVFAQEDVDAVWEEWCAEQTTEALEFIREKINNELTKRAEEGEGNTPTEQSATGTEEGEEEVIQQKTFDNFTVKITDIYTMEQYGTPCLVIEYKWSHNMDEATEFMFTVSDEAYQDGIQLIPYTLIDGGTNTSTKIQAGIEYTCYGVFMLNNTTSPVYLEVSPYMDFTGRQGKLTLTINLV